MQLIKLDFMCLPLSDKNTDKQPAKVQDLFANLI